MEAPLDPGPVPALRRIVSAFETLGIDYYIGGSIASSVHGVFRQTADVDFVAAIDESCVEPLTQLLQDSFYIDPESIREAIQQGTSFNVIFLDTMEKCDVFVHQPSAWGREQMATRLARPAYPGEREVWLESAACTVVQKLQWFQEAGGVSDRQWRDVLGVLRTQAEALDRDYLRDWAVRTGVAAELERALAEADARPPRSEESDDD